MVHHLLVLNHATAQSTSLDCSVTNQSITPLYALSATSALMVLHHVWDVHLAVSITFLVPHHVQTALLVCTVHLMAPLCAIHVKLVATKT